MRVYKVIFALAALGALATIWLPPVLVLGLVLLLGAVVFLSRRLDFGLIILVFFFPYLGLTVDFGGMTALRSIPYIKNVNAPFVDLYGLVLFTAWLVHLLFRHSERLPAQAGSEESRGGKNGILQSLYSFRMTRGIHLKSYLLFWLSGLVSLFKVSALNFATSLKYFVRPFTFFYLVFFAAPVSIMTSFRHPERSEEHALSLPKGSRALQDGILRPACAGLRMTDFLEKVLWVFYWTGLLSAVNGFLGLVFGAWTEFPRATPFAFLGVNPLGPNHNLLAETLIATAPAGLILINKAKLLALSARWIQYGMVFQWIIALLTFARTAWIAIFAQAAVYLYLEHRRDVRAVLKRFAPVLILVAVLAVFLGATAFTETVRGSTLSRLDMARIVEFYFLRSPWVGQGVGTFLPLLWQTKVFTLEYGEPLEAHGILFKLALEQGLLGLTAFVIFTGSILISIRKSFRKICHSERSEESRANTRNAYTNEILRSPRGSLRITDCDHTALVAALLIAVGSLNCLIRLIIRLNYGFRWP